MILLVSFPLNIYFFACLMYFSIFTFCVSTYAAVLFTSHHLIVTLYKVSTLNTETSSIITAYFIPADKVSIMHAKFPIHEVAQSVYQFRVFATSIGVVILNRGPHQGQST